MENIKKKEKDEIIWNIYISVVVAVASSKLCCGVLWEEEEVVEEASCDFLSLLLRLVLMEYCDWFFLFNLLLLLTEEMRALFNLTFLK